MKTIEQEIYLDCDAAGFREAFLTTALHSEITGAEASISDQLGEAFSAYDGYINGRNILIEKNRIVQSWIADEPEWPDGHISEIELGLEESEKGLRISFVHREVPEALFDSLAKGWYSYYWESFKSYFSAGSSTGKSER